jgi:hypothetical protein
VKCFCPKAAFAGQVKVCRNDWFLEKRQNLDYFLKKKNSGFSYLLLWQENRKKNKELIGAIWLKLLVLVFMDQIRETFTNNSTVRLLFKIVLMF